MPRRGRRKRRRRRRLSVEALAAGRYRVERILGTGGMATVYLARDTELDRPVAVKLLAEHLFGDADSRARFLREARLAARLSHPNVVAVFDAGEDERRPYIVMEFVDGPTLADVLAREGRLPPARVVDLALQVCGGLEHAHAAGLVHRDVKPGNLLLRSDGTVKIADFGIARTAETTHLTQVGSVLGTAAYLAPEQALGEPVTAAADLYSFGCVLYELLTGRTPHRFETLPQLVVKHREEAIVPLREREPEVPEKLEAAVMHCLARNPEYRPSSAAELAHELAAASPEPPTQALPQPAGVRATDVTAPITRRRDAPAPAPSAPGRRRTIPRPARGTALAALVAAALVGGGIGLAVVLSGDGGGEPPAEGGTPGPVPDATDPAEQARNLAAWLRENAD